MNVIVREVENYTLDKLIIYFIKASLTEKIPMEFNYMAECTSSMNVIQWNRMHLMVYTTTYSFIKNIQI